MKYINQKYISDKSKLRKNYLDDRYKLSIRNIKNDIVENYMWISVETRQNGMMYMKYYTIVYSFTFE